MPSPEEAARANPDVIDLFRSRVGIVHIEPTDTGSRITVVGSPKFAHLSQDFENEAEAIVYAAQIARANGLSVLWTPAPAEKP